MTVPNTQLLLFQRCSGCKEDQPYMNFPRNARQPTGYHNRCKVCHSNAEKKRYRENKADIVASRRLRRHGVSAHTYEFLMKSQDGKCADCERPFADLESGPCVDHDHDTGRVRALLCNACNLRLGMAHHSVDVLIRDVIYLLKHSAAATISRHVRSLANFLALTSAGQHAEEES